MLTEVPCTWLEYVLYNFSMPDDPFPGAFVHTYRPTLGRRIGSLAVLGMCAMCIGAPSVLVLAPVVRLLAEEPQARLIVIGGLCLTAPLWAVFFLLLVQILLSTLGMLFGNYLRVGPEGLVQRAWPFRNLRCDWSEVERIGKYYLVYEAIYLKEGGRDQLSRDQRGRDQISRDQISRDQRGRDQLSRDQRSRLQRLLNPVGEDAIPLSGTEGWPNGALRDDLRRYAPRLFDPATGKPAARPAQPSISGHSRDECLYACLSHAGALLLPVFIPLGFWLAERKKSAYVAFQAMQALVFQIIIQVMFGATLACALCGLLAPVALIQLGDRFVIDGQTYGLIILAAFGLAGLLSTIGLLMLLYAGVAMARTYRGEDFRYPVIGRWVEGRNWR
jgi:uncharacterized Tic20 family protein